MENNISQRNKYDMIMELLALHVKLSHAEGKPVSSNEIEGLFKKYSGVVRNL